MEILKIVTNDIELLGLAGLVSKLDYTSIAFRLI